MTFGKSLEHHLFSSLAAFDVHDRGSSAIVDDTHESLVMWQDGAVRSAIYTRTGANMVSEAGRLRCLGRCGALVTRVL